MSASKYFQADGEAIEVRAVDGAVYLTIEGNKTNVIFSSRNVRVFANALLALADLAAVQERRADLIRLASKAGGKAQ
jgi:myosin-crossreactive antigen